MRFRSFILILLASCATQKKQTGISQFYNEQHRPQIHFSPKEKWMNDPNGMVYYNNQYHLFYQYYPDSTVWGPMHWGHATSKDLVHWTHLPIALYPDSLGYIFSGSAVADFNNTSGFGKDGKVPIVAIFTHHDPKGERARKNNYQTQSIAYSLDEGKTWTKYNGNPVVANPGIRDFRDPKVMWFEEEKKWVMALATRDRVTFFSSKNLKEWVKESEFGSSIGAHGGVWECPELLSLNYQNEKIWILMVSLNPGGPNKGSATQYFTGKFDGKSFIPFQTDTRWVDYGPDDYAGVTWFNTGERKIFLGWMSNWQYATRVPTVKWRSAMTIPRDLGLQKVGDRYLITSQPVKELTKIQESPITLNNVLASSEQISNSIGKISSPAARLDITSDSLKAFTITLSNDSGEKVVLGYDKLANSYFIDRTNSGKIDFEKGFAARHTAPRLISKAGFDLKLIIDQASVELFADDGLSVMTQIFFPNSPFNHLEIKSDDDFILKSFKFYKMKSIWQ
jgi:fructan beta-fructosidase